ncbi:MAG: hypothetical protein HKO92_06515 [Flavobacteriaceae bacterium]|nr:hypothetical protein [Flavobacteriaceae bacterium]
MSIVLNSTLVEVHKNLNKIIFNILQALEPDAWKDQGQIVYSTVNDWDTAYQSYLVKNNIEEVKFPFASLTRNETQNPYATYNDPFTVWQNDTGQGARIKPVRIEFELVIYRREYINLESIADYIIVQGTDTQKYSFYSEILEQDTEFSFHFETPSHAMVAGKEEKLRSQGFIFSLNIPIVVDCVLGLRKDQKLITTIVQKTILENTDPEIILDSQIITTQDE